MVKKSWFVAKFKFSVESIIALLEWGLAQFVEVSEQKEDDTEGEQENEDKH